MVFLFTKNLFDIVECTEKDMTYVICSIVSP